MLPLTVWMNYPSFYQGDLFRSLRASGRVDLQVIFAKRLPADRLQLGWDEDLHGYAYRFLDPRHRLSDARRLAWAARRRLHIVNGIWAEPAFTAALITLAAAGSRYAIYSEAPEPHLRRSAIKRALRGGFGRVLAARASGLLPVSHLAADFYRQLGVRQAAIYPFGYFRSRARGQALAAGAKKESACEIVFAGQMIPRKGLDLLLSAVRPLFDEFQGVTLTLIGEGDGLPALRAEVERSGLARRVRFEPSLSPAAIPARLSTADLLVLPSRWDGWGVVVNEAFSVGVPVIVSDQCGAADLIRAGQNGYVFRAGDADDLRNRLRDFLDQQTDWPRWRINAAMMGERVSTEAVSPYLIDCLNHMIGGADEKPVPPWTALSAAQAAD